MKRVNAADDDRNWRISPYKGSCLLLADQISSTSAEMDEYRHCPLCQSRNHNGIVAYSVKPWRIVECSDCSFVFLANPVTYSELSENHAWEISSQKEAARRNAERPLLNHISKGTRWRLAPPWRNKADLFRGLFRDGPVLDIGCGIGHRLPPPLIPFGIEISKQLASAADQTMRQRGGHCVHAPAIDGIKSFESSFFSGVLLNSFLEHENNPLPLLREVARILVKDGVAYVRVPNYASINRQVMGAKWCGLRYPDHVNYFTAGSLADMAGRAGLRIRVQNWINLPVDDNIKAVLYKDETHAN